MYYVYVHVSMCKYVQAQGTVLEEEIHKLCQILDKFVNVELGLCTRTTSKYFILPVYTYN